MADIKPVKFILCTSLTAGQLEHGGYEDGTNRSKTVTYEKL